ncbi:MAG: hypothetical protein A2X32_00625 [Elusimicrobia bacterium GWC2_64_44]|nr:MAG: hypothetical protein A2X32_00625 [Elusimicrobia bacterium GWC2_64_44]
MSWAWRIDKAGDIGYKDLETRSAKWGRGEAVRGQLLSKVREIINKGQVRRLTVKEDSDLENANAELRAILSGSRTMAKKSAGQRAEKQAAIDKAAREFLEVEAKHWAWRIAVVRSITYSELKGYSDSWMRGVEVSDELLAKVKVNLESGDTPALSKAEQAKLDAGNKKIKEIVSRV